LRCGMRVIRPLRHKRARSQEAWFRLQAVPGRPVIR
jgi:hypothetical protein